MKVKIVFILFIILIIMVLVNSLINREIAKIQSIPQVTKQYPVLTEQQKAIPGSPQRAAVVLDKRKMITVVKPLSKEETASATKEEIKNKQKPKKTSLSQSQGPAASGKAPGEISGLTKSGRRPSEQEVKEMNARGIVIY